MYVAAGTVEPSLSLRAVAGRRRSGGGGVVRQRNGRSRTARAGRKTPVELRTTGSATGSRQLRDDRARSAEGWGGGWWGGGGGGVGVDGVGGGGGGGGLSIMQNGRLPRDVSWARAASVKVGEEGPARSCAGTQDRDRRGRTRAVEAALDSPRVGRNGSKTPVRQRGAGDRTDHASQWAARLKADRKISRSRSAKLGGAEGARLTARNRRGGGRTIRRGLSSALTEDRRRTTASAVAGSGGDASGPLDCGTTDAAILVRDIRKRFRSAYGGGAFTSTAASD